MGLPGTCLPGKQASQLSSCLWTAHWSRAHHLQNLGQPSSTMQQSDPAYLPSLPAMQPFKDTSAAAIAASGLLRLAQLSSNQTYAEAGAAMLNSLTASYLGSTAPAPLALASVLRNGSWTVPGGHHSTGLIWGDYYFLDALAVLHGSSSSEGLPPAGEPAPAPLPAAAAQPTLEIS